MQINSIKNINFGLTFTHKMQELLDISYDVVVKQGKAEADRWEKNVNAIKKIFPKNYLLSSTIGAEFSGDLYPACISLETPLGHGFYSVKGEDIFELDNNKTILDNENLEKLKAKLLQIKAAGRK